MIERDRFHVGVPHCRGAALDAALAALDPLYESFVDQLVESSAGLLDLRGGGLGDVEDRRGGCCGGDSAYARRPGYRQQIGLVMDVERPAS